MGLHKLVNGKKVDLDPEEEKKVKAEWAENEVKHEQARIEHGKQKAKKEAAMEKIYALAGLTAEEKQLLKGNL